MIDRIPVLPVSAHLPIDFPAPVIANGSALLGLQIGTSTEGVLKQRNITTHHRGPGDSANVV